MNKSADAEIDMSERRFVGAYDLLAGLADYPLWTMLGWSDVRQRYRRSGLGPLWITLSTGMFIGLLGVLYSQIFNQRIDEYLPFVAVGLICWYFISGTAMESCLVFIESTGTIKQVKLPFSIYPLRMIWRSFIVFLHTAVLLIPIGIYFHVEVGMHILLVIPGLCLLVANQLWLAIVVGVLSTRYRDIMPLVQATIQISMLATPIIWPISVLSKNRIIAEVNPIYHLIEVVRAPLLSDEVNPHSWVIVGAMCIVGYVLAAILLSRANRRLVYWL